MNKISPPGLCEVELCIPISLKILEMACGQLARRPKEVDLEDCKSKPKRKLL
jgi:hypothetical protein